MISKLLIAALLSVSFAATADDSANMPTPDAAPAMEAPAAMPTPVPTPAPTAAKPEKQMNRATASKAKKAGKNKKAKGRNYAKKHHKKSKIH